MKKRQRKKISKNPITFNYTKLRKQHGKKKVKWLRKTATLVNSVEGVA